MSTRVDGQQPFASQPMTLDVPPEQLERELQRRDMLDKLKQMMDAAGVPPEEQRAQLEQADNMSLEELIDKVMSMSKPQAAPPGGADRFAGMGGGGGGKGGGFPGLGGGGGGAGAMRAPMGITPRGGLGDGLTAGKMAFDQQPFSIRSGVDTQGATGLGGGKPSIDFNGTKLTGIEGSAADSNISLQSFKPQLQAGAPGVALSTEQAAKLGVKLGDKVAVVDKKTGETVAATFYDSAGHRDSLGHMEMSPGLAKHFGIMAYGKNGNVLDAVNDSAYAGRFEIRKLA